MTNDEILKLKKASELGDRCFEYICTQIKVGMTEIEIAKLMDDFMMNNGASGLAFDTIVGSGVNSAQIHSVPTDRKIEFGDIILLDFGCILDGYCSDTSRTIFVGTVKDEYRRIYDIVLEAQLKAIREIKPGMTCREVDAISRNYIKNFGYDFNHALGHAVSTVVHAEPVISPKREDIIDNEMVFTIEPGIYLENQFGVRIEDTVLLENGIVKPLSKAVKDIVIL